jgi:hypothetical protein
MTLYCSHIVEDFCHVWKYEFKPGFFNIVDEGIGEGYNRKIVTGEDSAYWVFKAVNFYCKKCPAFRNK